MNDNNAEIALMRDKIETMPRVSTPERETAEEEKVQGERDILEDEM